MKKTESKTESKIIEISNTFKNIYRLTLENEMIVDVYENESPCIDSIFSYKFFNEYKDDKFIGTEMRGYIYKTTHKETYVSFGGLLCKIPKVIEYDNKKLTIIYDIF